MVEAGPLEHLCENCAGVITLAQPPHCLACGAPFAGLVEGARRCPTCIELDPAFGAGRTGMLLQGTARVVVHELKYHQARHLRTDLRALVSRAPWLVEFAGGAVLVPVPLHPKRLRRRGFNQARLVAEALAAETQGAKVAELLERVRDTATQTRLNREERQRNVKGAFALKPGATVSAETRYVLVDDVFTTGATMNACAKVLRRAGAEKVDVATLAHG